MKRFPIVFLLGLAGAQGAWADLGVARQTCAACHAFDTKIVGPAFKDVAAKYKSVPGADALLGAKIRAGGSGVWGTAVMPPAPQISERDAKKLAQWVLGS
jgi:cytochrome c